MGVACSGCLQPAKCIHGLIVKHGQLANVIVGTALLSAYARCQDCRSSYRVFSELRSPGLISYNAMISSFVLNDCFDQAFLLFNKSRNSGLLPDVMTTVSLVRASTNLLERKLCESVHGLSIKVGLLSDASVSNSLLSAYSSFGDANHARRLFEKMKCKDVISWSTMMSLYIQFGDALEVLKLFNIMRSEDLSFDDGVIINLISAFALLADFSKGRQVHAQVIVSGYCSDVLVMNSVISMYSRCGHLDHSRGVFDRMAEKSVVSWSAMISGCAQNGCPKEAVSLWTKAKQEVGISLDFVALMGVLAASAKLGALELCQQLHGHTFRAGYSHRTTVLNGLISAYSKCGSMGLSVAVFREMSCHRDVVSWNAVLSGYALNGSGEEAIRLYEEMREQGVEPDNATYLIVLNACSHAALVECGLMIFRKMTNESGITPNEHHFGCLVDLFARAGLLRDASCLANNLCGTASPEMWKPLLSGCVAHGDVELAELASAKLVELGAEGSERVVLLSNAYSSQGRYQEAQELRWTVDEKGMRKNPGISSVLGTSLR
ncbi:hypothetical protein MLD38_023422 [Melastoma candidum]|uniref:Uncharacterized protein n=1 Tax=Melastoma candidum TaxID=119954 RepID=A0ACB9QRG6_9MYRT|nr:hypothetical protein MLD38_023422 [Melastoma candidum]